MSPQFSTACTTLPAESPSAAALAEPGKVAAISLDREAWADELLAHDFPALAPVIDGLLLPGLTILSGRPKTGKSFLALWIAYAVSTGSEVLGRSTAQSSVLYFALEDSPRRIMNRLSIMRNGDSTPIPIKFIFRGVNSVVSVIDAASAWLESQASARLVIVDIYGRIAPSGSTGSTEYQVVSAELGRLQAYAGDRDLAILLLHHTRKSTAQVTDAFDSPLGTTAITGIADTNMVLSRARNTPTSTLPVTGRDVEETSLTFEFAPDRRPATSGEVQPAAPRLSDARREVLRAVQSGAATPREIAKVTGRSRTAVQNQLQQLCLAGHVRRDGRGTYHAPALIDQDRMANDVTHVGSS